MSVAYTSIGWSRHKKIYDLVLLALVLAYVGAFYAVGRLAWTGARTLTDETLLLRALGTCALLMLHVVLWIGPLARLDRRLLPLLYNRRHLGVATFLVAAAHALFTLAQYQASGDRNPLVALLEAPGASWSLARFPFELLGAAALAILFLMAATSHDFWLKNLSPRLWKRLHMLVYAAYALLLAHVALGFLQSERHWAPAALLAAGAAITIALHLAAGLREARFDARSLPPPPANTFVDVCAVDDIPEKRARIVCVGSGERVAVFRHDGLLSAVSNVCEHQGGPLGEGKIVGGCITCPWHGYQYLPENGQSPPPFTEKIHTYRVRVVARRVQLDPSPLPKGTPVEPARIAGGAA